MKSMDRYFTRRLLGGILIGLAGYLRSASVPEPKARQQRYMLLIGPVLPELLVGIPMRFNTNSEKTSSGALSCLPFYLSPFAFVAYWLFLRPRIDPGRQLKNTLLWRRIAVVLLATGLYFRASALPEVRSRGEWLIVAGPVAGEVVEEVVEKRNPKLARRLATATAAVPGLIVAILGLRKLREEE